MEARRITCLWPGLPRLWIHGEVSALRGALVFAALLNFALMTTFLWPWRFPLVLPVALWSLVVPIWAVSFWSTWRRFPEPLEEKATIYEDLFLRAQAEYLRGDYFAAEAALDRLIRRRPQDIEARLLLAGVYRRTGRFDMARKHLRRLARTGGAKWALEVSRELALIDRSQQAPSPPAAPQDDDRRVQSNSGSHSAPSTANHPDSIQSDAIQSNSVESDSVQSHSSQPDTPPPDRPHPSPVSEQPSMRQDDPHLQAASAQVAATDPSSDARPTSPASDRS